MKFIEAKLYAGIDYEFRPASYWTTPSDPLKAILRNVKGRNRREDDSGLLRGWEAASNELLTCRSQMAAFRVRPFLQSMQPRVRCALWRRYSWFESMRGSHSTR
jgi:hypothetical protein